MASELFFVCVTTYVIECYLCGCVCVLCYHNSCKLLSEDATEGIWIKNSLVEVLSFAH